MPAKPQKHLFDLIKSLTKTEKAYFTTYAKSLAIKKPLYVRLFELIEKQEIYDENAVKVILNIKSNGSFSILKTYLFEAIMMSLFILKKDTTYYKPYKQLIYSDILLKKELLDLSIKEIDKIDAFSKEQQILELDVFSLLMKVKIYNKKIYYSDYLKDNVDSLLIQKNKLIQNLDSVLEARLLYSKALHLMFKDGIPLTAKTKTESQKIISKLKLLKSNYPDTYLLFNETAAVANYYNSNLNQAIKIREGIITYFKKNNKLLKTQSSSYFITLQDQFTTSFLIKKYNYCEELIQKMKKLFLNQNMSYWELVRYHLDSMLLLNIKGVFTKDSFILKNAEKFILKTHKHSHNYALENLQTQIAIWYIGANNYIKASKILALIESNYEYSKPTSNFRLLKLLQIIVNYERENYELLDYALKNLSRKLRRNTIFYEFEKVFLLHIRRLVKTLEEEAKQELFITFQNDLNKIDINSSSGALLRRFDFNSWLESKITKQSFSSLVAKKFGNA